MLEYILLVTAHIVSLFHLSKRLIVKSLDYIHLSPVSNIRSMFIFFGNIYEVFDLLFKRIKCSLYNRYYYNKIGIELFPIENPVRIGNKVYSNLYHVWLYGDYTQSICTGYDVFDLNSTYSIIDNCSLIHCKIIGKTVDIKDIDAWYSTIEMNRSYIYTVDIIGSNIFIGNTSIVNSVVTDSEIFNMDTGICESELISCEVKNSDIVYKKYKNAVIKYNINSLVRHLPNWF